MNKDMGRLCLAAARAAYRALQALDKSVRLPQFLELFGRQFQSRLFDEDRKALG